MSLASGEYLIRSVHSGKVLDVEGGSHSGRANLIQFWKHGQANQVFCVENKGGWYAVKCKHSGLYWDISGASKSNSAKLIQYAYHGRGNQQFEFIDTGNGRYRINAKHSGR